MYISVYTKVEDFYASLNIVNIVTCAEEGCSLNPAPNNMLTCIATENY